ncbi:putative N-formylglutamate amidohydrolase [Bradyrhizobium sp. USDA 4461]
MPSRSAPTAQSAHNEPYLIDDINDFTIPVDGEARGLPHLLLEISNDLIGDADGQLLWAALITETSHDTKAKEPIHG